MGTVAAQDECVSLTAFRFDVAMTCNFLSLMKGVCERLREGKMEGE